MSLLYWLPLNGNLNNNGLSSLSPIPSATPTYNDNGKIGKCFASGSQYISLPLENVPTALSICFWVKPNSPSSWTDIFSLGVNDNRMEVSTTTQYYWYCNSSSTALIRSDTALFILDNAIWNHICMTSDGTTVKFYLNGVLTKSVSQSNSLTTAFGSSLKINIGARNGGDLKYSGYMNDFRIYDHCLSAKEVKEISKGLVAHYKLSGCGGENLVHDSLINETSYEYGFAGRTVHIESGKQYTLSVKGYISEDAKNDGTTLKIYAYKSDWRYCPLILSISDTKETIVAGTFTSNQTIDLVISSYSYLEQSKSGNAVTVLWYKFEEGSKSTPWCPNPSDSLYSTLGYNDGIEYDCSGYGNNGTKVGNIAWSGDSARYNGSYMPTTNSSYISTTLNTSGYANSYTFSYWAKISDMNGKMAFGFSDGNRLNLYPTNSIFCWNTGDSADNPFQNSGTNVTFTSYNGAWHHYAITGNGTTTTLYIDGEKKGTAKTYRSITGTKLFLSGWDTGTSYKWTGGNISDFRLYSTCFSESDVKSIYNVSASIDKTGVLFCGEISECEGE